MKHKVSELEGALLDAAVAKAEGLAFYLDEFGCCVVCGPAGQSMAPYGERYYPSVQWPHGGPIIEREGIGVARYEYETPPEKGWRADYVDGGGYFSSLDFDHEGATPLVAAMRCFVAGRFGDDEIELP